MSLDPALLERMKKSETRIFKAVFPGDSNHYGTLFGGVVLLWLDEVAFIAATRFTRKKVVTVSSDKVNFKKPIPSGSLVELLAKVVRVGNTSLDIEVEVYRENMYSDEREMALNGKFTFVTQDKSKI